MQKQKRKVFTSKAIKAVKKKRRADLVEYRKSLNESNYLGIFTSVAGYVRRPRFYMPTKRHDLEASVSERKDISIWKPASLKGKIFRFGSQRL